MRLAVVVLLLVSGCASNPTYLDYAMVHARRDGEHCFRSYERGVEDWCLVYKGKVKYSNE